MTYVPRPSRRGIFHNHNLCDFAEFIEVVSEAFCNKKKIVWKCWKIKKETARANAANFQSRYIGTWIWFNNNSEAISEIVLESDSQK